MSEGPYISQVPSLICEHFHAREGQTDLVTINQGKLRDQSSYTIVLSHGGSLI